MNRTSGMIIAPFLALLMILGCARTSCADGSGTGFVIARAGYVVTNYHVIADAVEIKIVASDGRVFSNVSISRKDPTNYLAILRVLDQGFSASLPGESPIILAKNAAGIGQDCFAIGFPFASDLGTTPRLSTGIVSSTLGVDDNPTMLMISNPIQPGNSGSPLLNRAGELIGVVVASLNDQYFFQHHGSIPQNVNFAIKAAYLRPLMDSVSSDLFNAGVNRLTDLSLQKQVEAISPFVMMISVRTPPRTSATAESRPSGQGPVHEPPVRTPPIIGQARVSFTKPVTKRDRDLVVTRISVLNSSNAPIARLTITETWYDKGHGIVAVGTGAIDGLLQPGEVQTIVIETPFKTGMMSNNYNFSHANGTVVPIRVERFR
jgi:hypothetical protein